MQPKQRETKLETNTSSQSCKQDGEVIAAIVEVNLIENKTDCILDIGASRHFYTNRELLHDYEDTVDGKCVFMGNSATAGVIEKGEARLKIVLEDNKVVLTKKGEFIGKGICPMFFNFLSFSSQLRISHPGRKTDVVAPIVPRPRDHRPLVQSSPPPCSVFTTIHESPTLKTDYQDLPNQVERPPLHLFP
ncbi:ty1-copia retrotransposon protein [Cucumis melo var. makuwa]|uniref:Ty1-copia retrotransposon protein n=2 Tax=Cucumis melo TaxID=3656 RepID=A0A5A7UIV6_CUCMM|nr:ty1-copia retrotransposon protein [Cucumis melo var. makuwa]TYK11025.1 ty1-copia retrotransposon protein [Cucumis melo var. makuwa]